MGRGRTVGVSYTETRPGQTVLRWLSGYLPFGCADDPGSNPDAAHYIFILLADCGVLGR